MIWLLASERKFRAATPCCEVCSNRIRPCRSMVGCEIERFDHLTCFPQTEAIRWPVAVAVCFASNAAVRHDRATEFTMFTGVSFLDPTCVCFDLIFGYDTSDIFVTLDLEECRKILPVRYFRPFQHNLPVWVVCLKTCPVPLKTARTCHGDCCKELIATVVGSMTFIRIRIFKNFACKMSHGSFLSRHLAVWHDVVALDCTTRTSLAVLHLDL